ncbi:MAG: hypothetical protein AVDCRST_MAG76-684 [uncultured Acidimicrobiales bacterium]|uniref:Uncharacterized protein n=1 Tax=uncultured Acidimicrobiales bacterium TaxID=310071 RepID=A0A6J4HEB7_9ACTN|nr:MAG: hypothetical protein AVDCRST_MAG76-684 [uncultured Acidimicrobiales bacterium]
MNTLLRAVTAVASITAGVLHGDIWANHGYRSAPIREMFVASAVLAVALGLLALVPWRLAAVPAAVANAVFLGAFALSRVGEVPTFHGGWSEGGLAPQGATILGVSTTLLLLTAEGLAVACGLASAVFGGERRSVPLPAGYARA